MRLAGSTDRDLYNEPLGTGKDGQAVYLRDIWPSNEEIREAVASSLTAEIFRTQYGNVWDGNETWNAIPVSGGDLYDWNEDSTYIQEPPFFTRTHP